MATKTLSQSKAKALAESGLTVHQGTLEDIIFDVGAISDLLIALGCGDTDVERNALYWLGRNLGQVGELLRDQLTTGVVSRRAAQ